jgi:hypothetical protein
MADTDNTYSFTTTEADEYLNRVAEEAQPDVNFILTTERSTVKGTGVTANLLFRKKITALSLYNNGLTLGREPLENLFVRLCVTDSQPNDWSALSIEADEETLTEELLNLRNEIGRLANILSGRTVRVNVESF